MGKNNLGNAFKAVGDLEQTTICYQQSVDTFLQMDSLHLAVETLSHMEDMYNEMGEASLAMECRKRILAINN